MSKANDTYNNFVPNFRYINGEDLSLVHLLPRDQVLPTTGQLHILGCRDLPRMLERRGQLPVVRSNLLGHRWMQGRCAACSAACLEQVSGLRFTSLSFSWRFSSWYYKSELLKILSFHLDKNRIYKNCRSPFKVLFKTPDSCFGTAFL